MTAISSLKNRVFLACAFVAVLSIALGTQFVTLRVSREAEAELRRNLHDAAELLEQHHRQRKETLELLGWLVADLPKLKAAVATGDGPTVDPIARDYRERLGSDILVITAEDGRVLASLGSDDPLVTGEALRQAMKGEASSYIDETGRGALQIATLPIVIGPEPPEVLGTLSVGVFLDDALAAELEAVTQSKVILVTKGRAIASSIAIRPSEVEALLGSATDIASVGGEDYVTLRVPLTEAGEDVSAVLLRSRSERLSFLRTFREGLLIAALFGVLLAIVLSYAVARTVTRPLAAITETMREMAATGDLARKIELRGPLVDEDATLLATNFNRLIDSIARFQREAASKERLSALGRMSTVIAHEIRNPLMIVKASLRSLRRERLSPEEVREAADDIDHEVARLNRMVGDVLDFARPIQIDLHPADVNAVCKSAAEAVVLDATPSLELHLDESLPQLLTDAERLRTALVNVLANAKEAVEGRPGERNGEGPDISLVTERADDKVVIVVRDRGVGISAEDLGRIFEPYFTAKRTGTGLGLAITKNIVESLGGTVSASSAGSDGSEIRIELFHRSMPEGKARRRTVSSQVS